MQKCDVGAELQHAAMSCVREVFAKASYLEVQMVDGAVCSQGVVAQPKVWVVAVLTELQRQAHGGLIN